VMLTLDILNGWLLLHLLRLARLPEAGVLLYLWNPLIVVESSHGGHVDTWMIFLMLLALWLMFVSEAKSEHPATAAKNRKSNNFPGDPYSVARSAYHFRTIRYALRTTHYVPPSNSVTSFLAPVLLALATLTKGLPLLLLPVLFWRWRWSQLLLYGLVTVGLLIPAGLAAGWGVSGPLDGRGLFGAIRIYTDQWNFNSGLFYWLETTLTEQGVTTANDWAKRLIGLALLGTLLVVWLKARRIRVIRPTLRLMVIPFMAHILLATTVHPWYLMTTLTFLPFLTPARDESGRRWLWIVPWLYLSWALALSYLTYLDPNDFRELAWVRRLEWWGGWGLLLLVWLNQFKWNIVDSAGHSAAGLPD